MIYSLTHKIPHLKHTTRSTYTTTCCFSTFSWLCEEKKDEFNLKSKEAVHARASKELHTTDQIKNDELIKMFYSYGAMKQTCGAS